MHRASDDDDSEPQMRGDLPPLPSKFFKPRPPRLACPQCERRFGTAEELNEHARRAHPPEAGKHSH